MPDDSAIAPRREHFRHGADAGIRGIGRTKPWTTRWQAADQAGLARPVARLEPRICVKG